MSTPILRQRSEIPERFTWNAPSVFATPEDWSAAAARLKEEIPAFARFNGKLAEGPSVILEALDAMQALIAAVGKIYVYATLTQAVNTADPRGAQMSGTAGSLFGQASAAVSYVEPELLAIGEETIRRWQAEEPRLKIYDHYFTDLFRKADHVRSAEVEELLGMVSAAFNGTQETAGMLTDADFRFSPARSSTGQELPVTQGTLSEILAGSDREARKNAFDNYRDTYLAFQNTLASNLNVSIQQMVFTARARRYASSLDAKLAEYAIPRSVFDNLLEVFRRNLPTWHRYWAVRRKALGVEKLHPYDIWAPLTAERRPVPFDQAVEWISASLAPLGEEYTRTLRRGVLEERWIDVYPSQGKSSSQFSAGWPGTHPFIFLNYDDTIFSASTTAHELGHSMHSYLAWQEQPVMYGQYSLFVAEVASNFHQAMLRAHLLATDPDPAFQISVIEEAMNNFHRYFFIMPTLARFELEMHERVERGEGLSAEIMNERMADLFAEGFGSEMELDRKRVGITWATFGHLYSDYYVYQYATGISAANALSRRILSGVPHAAENYLSFLKAGGSIYPLDALRLAGVDLTSPQPVEEAFEVLSGLVDRLEQLTAKG